MYNGFPYAYVKSLQGDIVAILDENGNTVVGYGYDAWGAPLWCAGELAETLGKVQPFRYRGYVFDEETGLYYLRSRYYNAQWGRFVNADDRLSKNETDICGKSLYVYCSNNPLNRVDPNGEAWWAWAVGAAVIVASIAIVGVTMGGATAGLAVFYTALGAIEGGVCAVESGKDVVEGAFVGAVGGAISSLSLCAGPLGSEEVLKWSIVGREAGTVLSGIFTDSVC